MTPRRRGRAPGPGDALDLFSPAVPEHRTAPARGRAVELDRLSSETHDVFASVAVGATDGDALVRDGGAAGEALAEALDAETAIPGASPQSAVSVSTLALTAKELVEGAFVPLWVRGEVSDFKAHRNGHWYFSLRDATSQVRCVIWGRDARRLPAAPDDGMQVVALGQMSVYAARSDLQLVVRTLEARGDGLWRKALERTRAALAADGLLEPERKRMLPRYPRRIAVITSPDGAALHDIVAVARRRWPAVELVVVAAKVQGDGAVDELCAAVERVGRWRDCDLVIIGRGGGAREDLWAFNEERLARALAACPLPTISAVGHEVDLTICDLVADLRAATPSEAAEAAVPVLTELRAEASALGDALRAGIEWQLADARARSERGARDLAAAASLALERRRAAVEGVAGRLHALSPLATLGRGFALPCDPDGAPLAGSADFAPGRAFDLVLRDGRVRAVTEQVVARSDHGTSAGRAPRFRPDPSSTDA